MNKQGKSLKSHVWRLIFIPALTICLFISVSISLLFINQLNKYIDMRGHILTEKTAHLLHPALQEGNLVLAEKILAAAIEEPFIRAAHLQLVQDNLQLHSGPRFLRSPSPQQPDNYTSLRRETPQSILFSHPLVSPQGGEPLGRIELELLSSPYIVIRHEMILLALLLTLACLVIAAYLALRLYQQILTPLEQLDNAVQQLARGKRDVRMNVQETAEFSNLAHSINTMAESMEAAQTDMQAHIDNAIEDLRETLETIEIQNVELDIARKEALEASRVKSEFLANTSHEIRTPLNGILGFINLTLKTDLSEKQRGYLETIRDSAQSLLTVINSILDFSKIEAGKLTLDYAPLPIRKNVDETLHLLAPDAHEKGLQLIAYVEPCIPKNLLGDALRFKQVLNNLLANAIKFSEQGNITVEVSTLERQETQITLKVTVTDQGIGLSAQAQAHLFNAFSQADNSASREHEGTGLGLAICKGLVERMQGDIGVVSKPDQGSSFWFTARLGIDRRQPAPSPLSDLSDYRVLLCGDNTASLRQLGMLLHEWQANSQSISAIHDCFPVLRQARVQGQTFDLLVLDIAPSERKIPPMLLNNLAEQLHSEFNCNLLVCCTASHQRLFRNQGEQGHIVFVDKPIAYDELSQSIGRLLNIYVKETRETLLDDARRPSPRVLLVDDNPANLQLATELLRGLNTQVISVSNGPQAIEQSQSQEFDIIFMDIQMPGMDGIEATRHIRSQEEGQKRTPIIALTAHSITEQKADLLISGMDDCISKPVSETQLAHIINRWVTLGGKKSLVVPEDQPDMPATTAPPPLGIGHEQGAVDLQLCLRLANRKPALARDMLYMLLQNLAQERGQISQLLLDSHYSQLGEQIHRLYGSSCYCGVPKLKHISGLLDKLFQAELYDQARDAIPALMHAIDELLLWQQGKDIDALFGLSDQETNTTP